MNSGRLFGNGYAGWRVAVLIDDLDTEIINSTSGPLRW